MIEREIYCYKFMHFGLKNAGATYQRLVNRMFKDKIGKKMEIYINDMLVKTKKLNFTLITSNKPLIYLKST